MVRPFSWQARFRLAVRKAGIEIDRWPARRSIEETLARITRLYDVDSVVDVGANTGQWATTLRLLGYRGPMLSIEPVEDAYEALVQASSGDPLWTTLRSGIGAVTGTATINIGASHSTSSLLRPNERYIDLYGDAGTVDRQTVDIVPLDTLDIPGTRVMLKVDTQGYDLPVLQGARELLSRVVAVQCELSVQPLYDGMTNDYRTMIDVIQSWGFELAGLFPISQDDRQRLLEMDGVFVAPSHVRRLPE